MRLKIMQTFKSLKEVINNGLRSLKILVVCFSIFTTLACLAKTQQKSFKASQVKSVLLEGVNIQASFVNKKNPQIEVLADKSLSVKIKNGQLKIINHQYKKPKDWLFSSKKKVIKVVGPSRPVEVFAVQSDLNFSDWESDTFISARKAQVKDEGRKGSLKAFIKEGRLTSHQHKKGSLYLKGFSLQTSVTKFSQLQAHFYFNEGSLKLSKGSGDLFFVTEKAPVHITSFSGNIKGRSKSSQVKASLTAKKNVNVFSKSGPLFFNFKATSAKLKAHSKSGKVYVPSYMNKQYSGKSTTAKGFLRGAKKEALVFLETETGLISVY